MLFKLLLVTVLQGQVYVDVLDSDLTRDDCITQMVELNKSSGSNEQVICYAEGGSE